MRKVVQTNPVGSHICIHTYTHIHTHTLQIALRQFGQSEGPLPDATTKVRGLPKNHRWRPKTWRWNDQMDEAIQISVHGLKPARPLKKGGKMAEVKEADTTYNDAKCVAKHAIWWTKYEAKKNEFTTVSPYGASVVCIAKQMDHTNQDIIGEYCVCNKCWRTCAHWWWQGEGMGKALS